MASSLSATYTKQQHWRERAAPQRTPAARPQRLTALLEPVPPATPLGESETRAPRPSAAGGGGPLKAVGSAASLPLSPHSGGDRPLGEASVAYHMGKARTTGSQMKALKAFLSQNTPHPPPRHHQFDRRLGVLATALTTEEKRALREAFPPNVELSFFVERRDKLLPQDVGRFPVYIKEHVPNNRTTITMPVAPSHINCRPMQAFVADELESFEHRKKSNELQRLIRASAIASAPERRLRWARGETANIHDDVPIDRNRTSTFAGDPQYVTDSQQDERATLLFLLALDRVRALCEAATVPRATVAEALQRLLDANVQEVNPRKEPGYIWLETFLGLVADLPPYGNPRNSVWRQLFRFFDSGSLHTRLQPLLYALQWAAEGFSPFRFVAVCVGQLASVPFVTTTELQAVLTAFERELPRCTEAHEQYAATHAVADALKDMARYFVNADRIESQYFRRALRLYQALVTHVSAYL